MWYNKLDDKRPYPYTRMEKRQVWSVSSMYYKQNPEQETIEGFFLPFGGKLRADNRWIKLSNMMPWDKIEEVYSERMSEDNGRRAIPSRVAFCACYIKQYEKLSDERTPEAIAENPYMQYFAGLHEFTTEPLFDSSMMVHFRKRFPVNFVADVNEYICTGKWPENSRDADRNHDDHGHGGGTSEPELPEPESAAHSGKLILDATVAPADIKYPTDIDLLNRCREYLETALDIIWPLVPHDGHKLPYNPKKARKSYLNISKSKKWTKAKLSKGIADQLRCIELARARLQQLLNLCPAAIDKFPSWLRKRLQVVPLVYEQQKEMFDNNKRSCENRIVSTEQPHVRPIVRGKRPEPTEFGQKLHLSVVDGYVYLEQTSWNSFIESGDLKTCVAEYYRRFGCYPEAILADKIYQTKENRKFCKRLGIRLSGPALGRKSREQSELEKKQMYKDSCERNWIEGKNGLAKRRYGLDLIMSKLDENAKTEAAFALLVMNASRKLRELLSYLFQAVDVFGLFGCSNLDRLFVPS